MSWPLIREFEGTEVFRCTQIMTFLIFIFLISVIFSFLSGQGYFEKPLSVKHQRQAQYCW